MRARPSPKSCVTPGLRANARFGGTIHDFVMLNALHDTEAARHAVMLAVASLSASLRPAS